MDDTQIIQELTRLLKVAHRVTKELKEKPINDTKQGDYIFLGQTSSFLINIEYEITKYGNLYRRHLRSLCQNPATENKQDGM